MGRCCRRWGHGRVHKWFRRHGLRRGQHRGHRCGHWGGHRLRHRHGLEHWCGVGEESRRGHRFQQRLWHGVVPPRGVAVTGCGGGLEGSFLIRSRCEGSHSVRTHGVSHYVVSSCEGARDVRAHGVSSYVGSSVYREAGLMKCPISARERGLQEFEKCATLWGVSARERGLQEFEKCATLWGVSARERGLQEFEKCATLWGVSARERGLQEFEKCATLWGVSARERGLQEFEKCATLWGVSARERGLQEFEKCATLWGVSVSDRVAQGEGLGERGAWVPWLLGNLVHTRFDFLYERTNFRRQILTKTGHFQTGHF